MNGQMVGHERNGAVNEQKQNRTLKFVKIPLVNCWFQTTISFDH